MDQAIANGLFKPPGTVIEIARKLVDAGHETWCVGGAIRDALLGHSNLDWDIATAATPQQVRRLFKRTVPVGIEFGTIGVLDVDGRMHEVTTFRKDVRTDGRHAEVEFGASLDEDLARRDFTINAIAYDALGRRLHDPFDGRADIARRTVRAVGVAQERMTEDRLRALRAIRFASRFEFEIETSTWAAIVDSAPHMGRLSPERVKQEIDKTMEQVARPSVAFELWQKSGAFATLIPALSNVSTNALDAIDALPRRASPAKPWRRQLRMAALLSDLDGTTADKVLRALRSSNQETSWIAALVDRWQKLGAELERELTRGDDVSDAQLRTWAATIGRLRVSPLLRLAAAIWTGKAQRGEKTVEESQIRRVYRRMVRIAFHDAIETGDLAIDGDDLRSAGIAPGPIVGRILSKLIADVVVDQSLNNREWLLAQAKVIAADAASTTAPGGRSGN